MASIAKDERRMLSGAPQHRLNAPILLGELGLYELQFQFSQDFPRPRNLRRPFSNPPRHFQQNATNLSLLFFQQAPQFVVLLDGFHRLDENRLSAGTRSVYNALDAPLLFGLHRYNETLAANRDDIFLSGSVVR
jgi:hypothetical protein